MEILRSQIGTSSWGGIRYAPMAFTEQGVAMLSSVLNSGYLMNVWLQSFAYMISVPWWSFILVGMLNVIVALP